MRRCILKYVARPCSVLLGGKFVFFSFLAAMMLAYQPVRSLATLNITIQQGLMGSRRVLPIIDDINEIQDTEDAKKLKLTEGEVEFDDVNFVKRKNVLFINV